MTQNNTLTLHETVFSYKTILEPAKGEYREKGSKFLAFAFPVDSDDAIKSHLESIRKEYFDARHHCYAWVLGPDKSRFRAFDDGEPNHSAGDPILGQIRSQSLTNVLIIVVRYFGGVKLGVGGLVTAYKSAAADALSHATTITKDVTSTLSIQFDYACTPEVMRMVKDLDLRIVKERYGDVCTIQFRVKLSNYHQMMEKVKYWQALSMNISIVDNE